jgi:hypothetical protein
VTSLPVGTARPAVIALVAGAAVGLTSLFAVRFLPQPANLLGTLGSSPDALVRAVTPTTRRGPR